MTHSMRGLALPETAVALSVVLMVLFGIIQLAFLGYTQVSAQGAAFVAAHAAALNATGNSTTDQTYARGVISAPFPNIKSSDVALTEPGSGGVPVVITKTLTGGMPMISLNPNGAKVYGTDIEAIPSTVTGSSSSGSQFAVQAKLANYWDGKGGSNSSYQVYIGQFDPVGTKANGKNGQFGEWKCRPGLFLTDGKKTTSWPSTMPAPGSGTSNIYDPANTKIFVGAPLYAFDSQTSQWGSASSC